MNTVEGHFNAKEFVDNLLEEGAQRACDNTNGKFTQNFGLPDFYDEEKFKKGQIFYYKYQFMLFFGKLLGLVSILAVPTILKILMFTKMSNEPLTSYKRYLATIFHMNVWYRSDFKPGSQLWNSLQEVRRKHNSASKRSCCAGSNQITQMDMALTQFGFMGFALSRADKIGIHTNNNAAANDEEYLQGFVHLWAVVGHLMGIEKAYNICRESVKETQSICEELVRRVFRPLVEHQTPDFVRMSSTLIDSMTTMQPFLEPQVFNLILLDTLDASEKLRATKYEELTRSKRSLLWFVRSVVRTYRFTILRLYHNLVMIISLWLMHNFPFLAIKRFGRRNSYVTILADRRSASTVMMMMNSSRNEQQCG